MRRYDVPDRDTYFQSWSDLHGGYDPDRSMAARGWLGLAYVCARPLARRGVAPHLITVAGGLVGGLVVVLAWRGGGWLWLGAIAAVGSGLLDSLDGAIAAMTDRCTAVGYVLDSMVDRISDGCFLLALWLVGAPAWLCVLAGAVTMLQEYLRARAASAGSGEVDLVTIAERPTRVIITALALCGAAVVPSASAGSVAAVGALAWLGLSAVAFGQLAWAVRSNLSTG